MKNYQKLKVWKTGMEIAKKTYELTKFFPQEERYGLTAQVTRAAVSIPANIAEGSSRKSEKDYKRFLRIALGSAFELQTYFMLIQDLEWTSEDKLKDLNILLEEEIKMIHGFIRAIGNS